MRLSLLFSTSSFLSVIILRGHYIFDAALRIKIISFEYWLVRRLIELHISLLRLLFGFRTAYLHGVGKDKLVLASFQSNSSILLINNTSPLACLLIGIYYRLRSSWVDWFFRATWIWGWLAYLLELSFDQDMSITFIYVDFGLIIIIIRII